MTTPKLSVVVPTFNNVAVLSKCLESWRTFAACQPVEVIVIEDGCSDGTPGYLDELSRTAWFETHFRWIHEPNLHELRCTNRGLRAARAPVTLAWQDDMFLRCRWLVPEIINTFERYRDLGLISLSRGLDCHPFDEPITRWEDLTDSRRLVSTIGPRPLNWFQLQEVDIVIRPWAVRAACLGRVGLLDEAFVPTEWDEADLAFRIREAGWKVATHGYERVGAYSHLGSTTISKGFNDGYKQRVLRNGRLFYDRWHDRIRAGSTRRRKTWWRNTTGAAWTWTFSRAARALVKRREGGVITPAQTGC